MVIICMIYKNFIDQELSWTLVLAHRERGSFVGAVRTKSVTAHPTKTDGLSLREQ